MKNFMKLFLAMIFFWSTVAMGQNQMQGTTLKLGSKTTANKDIIFDIDNGAANPRVRANGSTDKLQFSNDGVVFKDFGSGSGGGEVNLIVDGDAEGLNPFSITKNTVAGARPDVGFVSSGTTITATIPSTGPPNPINGLKSFLLSKPASNAQGQQFWIPITGMAEKYNAKVLTINTSYRVASGTFVAGAGAPTPTDGDLIVYMAVLNPNTAQWEFIEPSSIKFFSNSTTSVEILSSTFQTPKEGSSYRLIYHVASTSANAWGLQVDDISVSPSKYVYGTPISDWTSYTQTSSWGSAVSWNGSRYRRVGDSAEFRVNGTLVSAPSGALSIAMPPGLSADLSKNPGGGLSNVESLGIGTLYDASNTQNFITQVSLDSPTAIRLRHGVSGGTTTTPTIPFTFASTDIITFTATVPILGWSSSVQMSDSADTKTILGTLVGSSTQSISHASTVKVTNLTVVSADTYGGTESANSRIRALTSGWYTASSTLTFVTANTAIFRGIHSILKNGVTTVGTAVSLMGGVSGNGFTGSYTSIPFYLNAGEYVELHAYQDSGVAINLTGSYLNLTKVQGPSAIAANENVAVAYSNSSGMSIPTGVNATTGWTKIVDTHNAFNATTGTFTAPIAGIYEFCGSFLTDTTALNAGNEMGFLVNNNRIAGFTAHASATISWYATCTPIFLPMTSGQSYAIQIYNSNATTKTMYISPNYNRITIKRLGF